MVRTSELSADDPDGWRTNAALHPLSALIAVERGTTTLGELLRAETERRGAPPPTAQEIEEFEQSFVTAKKDLARKMAPLWAGMPSPPKLEGLDRQLSEISAAAAGLAPLGRQMANLHEQVIASLEGVKGLRPRVLEPHRALVPEQSPPVFARQVADVVGEVELLRPPSAEGQEQVIRQLELHSDILANLVQVMEQAQADARQASSEAQAASDQQRALDRRLMAASVFASVVLAIAGALFSNWLAHRSEVPASPGRIEQPVVSPAPAESPAVPPSGGAVSGPSDSARATVKPAPWPSKP